MPSGRVTTGQCLNAQPRRPSQPLAQLATLASLDLLQHHHVGAGPLDRGHDEVDIEAV